jgi:hypothetical protein
MLVWIIVICCLVIVSLIKNLGYLSFPFLIEPWRNIILDIILLFIVLGILLRMVTLSRKGEKESLKNTIKELLTEIKQLKGETEKNTFVPPDEPES